MSITGPLIHPGEILREEFMDPLGLTPYRVALLCGIPRTRIERVVKEQTPITADTALRLARLFGNSAQFWLNLQTRYDLMTTERSTDLSQITPLAGEQNHAAASA